MRTQQLIFQSQEYKNEEFEFEPQLLILFGSRAILEDGQIIKSLREKYPNTIFTGCSTSGEIAGNAVHDDTLAATAVKFDKTSVQAVCVEQNQEMDSYRAGKELIDLMEKDDLTHVFLLSEGLKVNGTDLVKGISENLDKKISVTGGLAGDGALFEKTMVITPEGEIKEGIITAVGFYGENLEVGYGSMGGWDSFGVERLVTKSEGNVLYEIDGEPALDLYKSFLGDNAKNLPASGLLFPLSMRNKDDESPLVRTILGIDEDAKSLTFAGDIPTGSFVRLMKSNSYKLIDGAEEAAQVLAKDIIKDPEFAILISCVGRKLVIKQLIDEEVEAVSDVLNEPVVTGFYSYGELAPFMKFSSCELHNQTMTITTFSEK